jgi:hypothetical protein
MDRSFLQPLQGNIRCEFIYAWLFSIEGRVDKYDRDIYSIACANISTAAKKLPIVRLRIGAGKMFGKMLLTRNIFDDMIISPLFVFC